MNSASVYRYVGLILIIDAVFMLFSCVVSVVYDFDDSFYPLLLSAVITMIVGVFPLVFVPRNSALSVKSGYLIVVCAWIASCIFGMLPYILWGGEFSFVNAIFESTSGFTTNGASILEDVEALPKGLIFWRSSTHWIGGIGVVLFALVIMPSMGNSRLTLTSVEISSLAKENFRFTSKNLFKILFFTYLILTVLPFILLMFAGMDVFDSINHAFSIAASGGFSTKNNSLIWWQNPAIEFITAFFLILSGTHLGLLYLTLMGKKNNMFKNDVWRFYVLSLLIGGIIVGYNLYSSHVYPSFWQSIRYGMFQVISYASSAGFATADDSFWPPTSILVIMVLSVGCAMAGSTSGGLKIDRIMVLLKSIRNRIVLLRHPNAVLTLKIGGRPQDELSVSSALIMVGFYMLVLVISTFVISLYNYDLLTSFSASLSTLGNIGPGFGAVSNIHSMSFFPDSIKLWLCAVMLFGRLELFGFLNIFLISSWK